MRLWHPGFVRRTPGDDESDARYGAHPPTDARAVRRPGTRRRGGPGRFVSAYGWRAYAVPVLVATTVLAGFGATRPISAGQAPAENAAPVAGGIHDSPAPSAPGIGQPRSKNLDAPPSADGTFDPSGPPGAVPPGGPIPESTAQSWHVVSGTTPKVGSGSEDTSTYTIEVQDGLDTASLGGDKAFARMVDATLDNPKSWTGDPRFAFQRIDSGEPSFRISLSAPMTVRDACGYAIPLEASCFNSGQGRVVINVARWVRGAIAFQGDLGSYRQYAINHEVGHAIGYDHQACGSDGGLAPVMMQQTFSTANNDIAALDPGGEVPANGNACRFNGWPFPRG